ncbi:MAG TPA: 2Fe-2S iron-sulfur cluster-binding protein [Povalibacter sp.]|mgnify:CR=1 FL=1|uniref:2Fe-2S iron-sulfur cluster-binding protein n=1 Tax=Povalibacter sp. TaxID=1962978 RepID=UPI002C6C2A38|nr:2Fe-2S iron-sulfur cluster-binding protein [Povalibacter sp.]HMN45371.1 2Fe-2S iron-sulfur cluster-binding protein [Povalibacter sp.]
MGRVHYIAHDGTRHAIELADGTTLMEGAVANGIPGIDGDCGGCAACGTCHVHVDPAWLDAVGPATDVEQDMLQFADGAAADSRLSCQIRMRADLDGLIVHLPESQH